MTPKKLYVYGDNNAVLTWKPTKGWIEEQKPIAYVPQGSELKSLRRWIPKRCVKIIAELDRRIDNKKGRK